MGFFRLISWVLLALAFGLLGADVISTMENGEWVIRTTSEIMALLGLPMTNIDGGSMASAANFILDAPLWAVMGVLGIVLTLIFRPID